MLLGTENAYEQTELQNATLDAQKITGTAQIDAQNDINAANAANANALRGSNNTLAAAEAALANFNTSASNYWRMKSAGAAYNANVTNLIRVQDRSVQGTLESNLRTAEQLGAVQAAAAATGTGGASSMMLQHALQSMSARNQGRQAIQMKEYSYDSLVQRAGIISSAIAGQNAGQTFAPVDFTQSVPNKVITPIWAADYESNPNSAATGYLLSSVLGNVAGSAANSFLNNSGSYDLANPPAMTTTTASFDFGAGAGAGSAGAGAGVTGIGTLPFDF